MLKEDLNGLWWGEAKVLLSPEGIFTPKGGDWAGQAAILELMPGRQHSGALSTWLGRKICLTQEGRGALGHGHKALPATPQFPGKAAPSGIRPFPGRRGCWGPRPWHGDAGCSLPRLPLFSESLETKGERSGWKLCAAVQEGK